jgi:hypothetical protein
MEQSGASQRGGTLYRKNRTLVTGTASMGKNRKELKAKKEKSPPRESGDPAYLKKLEKPRMVRATYPGGRVEVNPDDGRSYPSGTMLQFGETWTVVGCAWPFDD